MKLALSIILLFFSMAGELLSSPTMIKKIETMQCWEDQLDDNSDLDFSEPCELVIEYLVLDSQENLYAVARTARIIQSGDLNPTVVYFSIPLTQSDLSLEPKFTLGLLNFVTCKSDDVQTIKTNSSFYAQRTDTELNSGDQGVNCLGGNSTTEFLNTNGVVTHSGLSNYFLWTPGRCEPSLENSTIDPLSPDVATKEACDSSNGNWVDYIPKKTESAAGWDINYLSYINNGTVNIYSDQKGLIIPR